MGGRTACLAALQPGLFAMPKDLALLVFSLSRRRLALPLAELRHVAPLPHLASPIGAPPFVAGFFEFRGMPTAALRLDRLLGLDEEPLGIYAPLLILAGQSPCVALHVCRVEAVVAAAQSELQPIAGEETLNGCVVGCARVAGENVCVLASERILLAAEREKLAAHAAMRKRRLDALQSSDEHGHAR